ncbi:MAG: isochorismatase family cysteine hydrolase, partial [Chloroflexota bacterium]|nr:isochorismatase family cysteine hydrolase [Chloroflexota bacterium]
MATAVLVTDILRGFMEEGRPLYCGDAARRIIPRVQALLERETAKGSSIFYICDNHAPDDAEFQIFPPHCIAGTVEAEIIPELIEFKGEFVSKTRYSGFFESALEEKLKELAPEKLIVCGVCTDICVLHTVADARNRGYAVEVPTDCVASFDESAHRFALKHMESVLGAKLINPSSSAVPRSRFEIPEVVLSGDTADIYFPGAHEIDIG